METKISGKDNRERFLNFRRQVELIEDPSLSDAEIARVLKSTGSRVKRARKRLRQEGRASERTSTQVSMPKRRRLMPLSKEVKKFAKEKTISEIAKITGYTESQVKHQVTILRSTGELPKPITRAERKEKLKKIINKYMEKHKGENINLSQIAREENPGFKKSTVTSLYHEIAKEQPVPGLSNNFPRKKNIL